jgi:hypothetical protein
MELVPLIVKVGAINKLLNAAKRMRRVMLTRLQLFGTVAALSTIVVAFLVLWTILDPQQRQSEYDLTGESTVYGETVVTMSYYCSSDSDFWRYVAVAWHLVLLICATVLAFQTRKIREGFNESQVLAFMIYSHFFFVVLRVITFVLGDTVSESFLAELRSMIYSTDVMVTISIYFIPKFLTNDEKFNVSNRRNSLSSFQSHSRMNSDVSYALSVNYLDANNRRDSENPDNGNKDNSETADNGCRPSLDNSGHRHGVMSYFLTQITSDASPQAVPTHNFNGLPSPSRDHAIEKDDVKEKSASNGHRHKVSFADFPEEIHDQSPEQQPKKVPEQVPERGRDIVDC